MEVFTSGYDFFCKGPGAVHDKEKRFFLFTQERGESLFANVDRVNSWINKEGVESGIVQEGIDNRMLSKIDTHFYPGGF